MTKTIIKDRVIVTDPWRHVTDNEPVTAPYCTVSSKRWRQDRDALVATIDPIGVRLASDDAPEELAADLPRLTLLVLEFAKFSDGRGFSQARLFRERYGFTGEIRARGAFLRDQVFFLVRVGVNAFEFEGDEDLEKALQAINTFSVCYQAAVDGPLPLYRRRQPQ